MYVRIGIVGRVGNRIPSTSKIWWCEGHTSCCHRLAFGGGEENPHFAESASRLT